MNFKAVTMYALVMTLVATSISMPANGASSHGRRHGNPQTPAPTVPTFPREPFPGFPDDPSNPGIPTGPTIPPPGKPNPKGGPEVPFPLNITLPFPWGNIEGMWKVVSDGLEILFSFSVQTDTNGHQYLRVLQIDSATGTLVAEGVGIGVENDKLVRAAMTAKATKANYMLFIGSYKNTNSYVVGGQALRSITVVTVRPFSALMGDHDVQVIVSKVTNAPLAPDSCPMTAY
jgi:hypothetical protein